jgi:hypothetical protein
MTESHTRKFIKNNIATGLEQIVFVVNTEYTSQESDKE